MDENYRIVKITVSNSNVEILRDAGNFTGVNWDALNGSWEVNSLIHVRKFGFIALSIFLCVCFTGFAFSLQKDNKGGSSKIWDSGRFGIFMNGKRVGTEKFTIEQRSSQMSVANSEITVEDGHGKVTQTAEMHVAPNGELLSYVWKGLTPQKEQSTVEPKEQLLVEHVVPADQKKMDVPYILPPSTVILDDNFFSQRELLVWRYLATGCIMKPNEGRMCAPSHFGILGFVFSILPLPP